MRARSTGLAAVLVLAAAMAAQTPRPAQARWIPLRSYDEATSRAAFAACDGNADDRLDVFEARRCLERMGTLQNPEGFRRLDTDKDGHLSWPELDHHFRDLCARGGSLRIRPDRPFQRPRSPVPKATDDLAAAFVLRLGDKNQDGVLHQLELEALLEDFDQPKTLAKNFPLLDSDRSGSLNAKEIALVVRHLPALAALATAEAQRARRSQLARADRNKDGKVTSKELDQALRHLHPTVARWSRKIFDDADADGNGKLTGKELDAPGRGTPPPTSRRNRPRQNG